MKLEPWPREVRELYNVPTDLDGRGECVALIELGGNFDLDDLRLAFARQKLPLPNIDRISLPGASSESRVDFFDPWDREVTTALQVVGGVAPRAKLVVYFAANTYDAYLAAVRAAIVDRNTRPSVLCLAWSKVESEFPSHMVHQFQDAFEEAASRGITICCSSGNYGSSGRFEGTGIDVLFPASSPLVLACGGTRLFVSDGTISEIVWNDAFGASGGGFSRIFECPQWQAGMAAGPENSRALPDVSANAAYKIVIAQRESVATGTSAAAAFWAGLVALLSQALGWRLGHANPILYRSYMHRPGCFNDIQDGSNGAFRAQPGWDACTGLGTPTVVELLEILSHA